MWRIVMAGVLAIAGIAIAAPRAKDAKESPIVGEWRLLTIDGREATPVIYDFRANGDLIVSAQIGMFGSTFQMRYDTKEKVDPFQFDETQDDVRREGIYKVERERLTICFREGRGQRPKKFGERGATQEVFERVKKKKD